MPVYHNPSIHGEGTVCLKCRKKDPTPWVNPLLVTLRKLGAWTGSVMGGQIVCEACMPDVLQAIAAHGRPPVPSDVTNLPREFRDATFDNFLDRDGSGMAVNLTKIWLHAHDDRNLYLTGGVGSGKTRLACTAARAWVEDWKERCLFQTTVDLFDRLRAAEFRPAGDEGLFTLDHLVDYPLLLLDDLGAEKPTEYTCTRLLALLERRHQAGRPTILTSNLDLNDLAQRLGDDRLSSRLADWSDLAIVRSSDYRVERARQGRRR